MSEDDEVNFYQPWAGGLIGKGLSKTSNHPDMDFKDLLIKFTGLPESKNGK